MTGFLSVACPDWTDPGYPAVNATTGGFVYPTPTGVGPYRSPALDYPYYAPPPPQARRNGPCTAGNHCYCLDVPSSGKSTKPHRECCQCGDRKVKR